MTRKAKRKQTLRIFISYAIADRDHARKLRGLLSQRPNVRIFTPEMLSAGENWESKLKDELSKCDIYLVLLSPNAVNSSGVLNDLGAAWALGKHIVYINITTVPPEEMLGFVVPYFEVVEIKDLEKREVINRILERYEEKVATSH